MQVKPCPFCGSPAYKGIHKYHPGHYIIKCGGSDDKCIFPSTGPIPDGLLSVYIGRWNKRWSEEDAIS